MVPPGKKKGRSSHHEKKPSKEGWNPGTEHRRTAPHLDQRLISELRFVGDKRLVKGGPV